jgi:uncharacterized protein (DUF2249 family)
MVIRRGDRVSAVLARDASLVDVFASLSPNFDRLRDPRSRILSRLVTVESAARIAGVDADLLVDRLNAAMDGTATPAQPPVLDGSSGSKQPSTMDRRMSVLTAARPTALDEIAPEQVHDVDVREDLRMGQEPFMRIMAARKELPPGHVLRLRAIFEPVPLYHVMGKQGFAHWTEQLANDDWRVWFYPVESTFPTSTAPRIPDSTNTGRVAAISPDGIDRDEGEEIVVLDVRGMEPPEPMVRTLAALEALPEGATLLQINVRVPQFLLPRLEELGFSYAVREEDDNLVRVFIRRR